MTPARRRLERMLRMLAFVAATLAVLPISAQASVNVGIRTPASGATADSPLQIIAGAYSSFEIKQVTAEVEGRSVVLTYTDQAYYVPRQGWFGGWVGTLSLTGLSRGAHTLTVTATDVSGSTGSAAHTFVYDNKPVLTVQSPVNGAVARPSVRVAMSCTDDDPSVPCGLRVTLGNTVLASGQTSLDTTVSLADYDTQTVTLTLTATDSAGWVVTTQRYVHVESTPFLREVASVGGSILEVAPDRILYYETTTLPSESGPFSLKVFDRQTGDETTIFSWTNYEASSFRARLTPRGVIFIDIDPFPSRLYEWRDGVLTLLDSDYPISLYVSGNYAIWSRGGTQGRDLILRNLETSTSATIATTAGNIDNDVAANGDVVYWDTSYRVFRYRDGVTSRVPTSDAVQAFFPRTDGINVAYSLGALSALYTASGATIPLNERGTTEWIDPRRDYRTVGGWTAFTRAPLTGSAILQVWLRSPEGALQQVSFFGSRSEIQTLSPTGEVTFINSNKVYLYRPGMPLRVISSLQGTSFWLDGQWYVRIGRTVFAVDPNAGSCSYVLMPAQASYGAAAATGNLSLATSFGCPWTVTSSATWLTTTVPSPNYGRREFSYSVAANPNSQSRTATLTLAGQTHTVNQSGVACSYAISPVAYDASPQGASASVQVTTSTTDCAWGIGNPPSFVTVVSGASGVGNGAVTYAVSANTTSAVRSGVLRIAGRDHTINQQPVILQERIVIGTGPYPAAGGWFAVRNGAAAQFEHREWLRNPWSDYNARSGEIHPATGDLDGDGLDEIVIGLGTGGSGWLAVFDDAAHGYALLKWIQVQWPSYNAANGEVFPAVGDLDGDGRAEIVAGLGSGGAGWLQVFGGAASDYRPLSWHQVGWASYAAADGSTHPAVGDLDGDGIGELVVGLGVGGAGWLEISTGLTLQPRGWTRVRWDAYNAANGATFPALGRGLSGPALLVVGLGAGGGGFLEQFRADGAGVPAHLGWMQVGWAAYNQQIGATYPAVGNVDADDEPEIVVGLAAFSGNGGWFQIFDGQAQGFVSLGWQSLAWPEYAAAGGGTFPAIGRLR